MRFRLLKRNGEPRYLGCAGPPSSSCQLFLLQAFPAILAAEAAATSAPAGPAGKAAAANQLCPIQRPQEDVTGHYWGLPMRIQPLKRTGGHGEPRYYRRGWPKRPGRQTCVTPRGRDCEQRWKHTAKPPFIDIYKHQSRPAQGPTLRHAAAQDARVTRVGGWVRC
jgi:hypothetical protein